MAERNDFEYGENIQSVVEKQKARRWRVSNYSGMGMEQLWVCAKGKAKLMDKCNFKFFS